MWQQTAAVSIRHYIYMCVRVYNVYNMILYLLHYYNHAHSIYRGHARTKQRMVTCAVNNAQLMLNFLELFFVYILYVGRFR